MKRFRVVFLLYLGSSLVCKAQIELDPGIFSQPGVLDGKPILDKSVRELQDSFEWKRKIWLRYGKGYAYLLAPFLPSFGVILSKGRDFDGREDGGQLLRGLVLLALVATYCWTYEWYKEIHRKGALQDRCELDMQLMVDLKQQERGDIVQKIHNYQREKWKASRLPQDGARFDATRIGLHLPADNEFTQRAELAKRLVEDAFRY